MPIQTIALTDQLGHQSITLPDNMKIDDNKVYIKKMGNVLYIIPYHSPWQSLIDSIHKFTPDFMEQREDTQPEQGDSFN